jgi:hypothetical protein
MKKLIILLISISLFTSCKKEEKLTDTQIAQYIAKGKEIGKATVHNLGSNLMKHMKSGGPKEAIPFCNTNVSKLTNEMAKKYDVTIKRTSHKMRNDKNNPNENEQKILDQYLAQIKKGEQLKPKVIKETDGKVHFYAPMKVQAKCLACHGTIGKQVTSKTDSIIKSLYPNDKATDFKDGEFRGIVNITFNK